MIMDIEGRNNKVMISPRRMGKTGLILHCFHKPELNENYYCFFIDIYSTLNLSITTENNNFYSISDRFLAMWLKRKLS